MNVCRKLSRNGFMFRAVAPKIKEFNNRSLERFCCTTPTKLFDMEKEKKDFFAVLPTIIEDLGKEPKFQEIPVAKKWMEKVINGTVSGGKVARGISIVLSYKTLEKPENITEETVGLAQALGWCVELILAKEHRFLPRMLREAIEIKKHPNFNREDGWTVPPAWDPFQSYCVILDDIMDGSFTRRGKPCWYRREDVGLSNAINDSCLVYYCLLKILQDNFQNSPNYVDLYHIFNQTLLYTCIGQFLDVSGSKVKNYEDIFTKKNYETIIKYKSAYYTYKLPVNMGLILANHVNEESLQNCEEMSFKLGKMFQIQDDYIDCFGDEFLTGKMGSDIQEGKCTWLAVNALPRCTDKERAVFFACYGSKEPAHVERIKQLYKQLKLPEVYKQEERKMYEDIVQKIQVISSAAERELYQQLLHITYDRKK